MPAASKSISWGSAAATSGNATAARLARLPRSMVPIQASRPRARVRREERLTGIPHKFSYCLRETAWLTGLPVPVLRKLIRAGEISAHKTNGWWMIRRSQLLRLLPSACRPTY